MEYLNTPDLLLGKREDCGSDVSQASPDRPSSTSSRNWSISGMTLAGKEKQSCCHIATIPNTKLTQTGLGQKGNTVGSDRSQIAIQYGACALYAEYLRLQTHIQNTYGFSTATVVARTLLDVMLHVHFMSCLN